MYSEQKIDELVGEVLTKVTNTGNEIVFEAGDRKWVLYHDQDCCESVYVEDVVGDLEDLVGSVILEAEEVEDSAGPLPKREYKADSETWTFYKLATNKGRVTIRFYGSSNGYYSESVSFRTVE